MAVNICFTPQCFTMPRINSINGILKSCRNTETLTLHIHPPIVTAMPPSRVCKRVPKGRVYESEVSMKQQHFPPRRKIARVNHNPLTGTRRRDVGKATKTTSQQTLTQIEFVHTTPSMHDHCGDEMERQGQIDNEWEENRPAKRRRKTNSRRIPKLAGQDTLTQLDFVKVSRQPADATAYDVWLETSIGGPEPGEEHSIKQECPNDVNRSLTEIVSPTNSSANRYDASQRTKTLRKNVRHKGEPRLSPITVSTYTVLNSDAAPRSPLSDLSPNKPPSKISHTKDQIKESRKSNPEKRTTATMRESISPVLPKSTKRKQILAVANSDSEDADESSDNDGKYQSENSTVIIKVQNYRAYSANERPGPVAENPTHKCRSLPPSSSPTTLTSHMPATNATFTQEEILDSESARVASSHAGDDNNPEEPSLATYQINSMPNTLSETSEIHTHPEVSRNEQGHNKDSNDHDSLPAPVSPKSPKTRKKRPQKQDSEQSHSILPTPLSQATTVDPDTPNASSARSVRSIRSIQSIQPPSSSLRQESSLDQQEQEKELQQQLQQQQRHEPKKYSLAKLSKTGSSQTVLSDDNFGRHDTGANENQIITHGGSDWNTTHDLDEGGIDGYGSYSLPSSPVDVVTAENLLPESLMAFSIPPPPSYSRLL